MDELERDRLTELFKRQLRAYETRKPLLRGRYIKREDGSYDYSRSRTRPKKLSFNDSIALAKHRVFGTPLPKRTRKPYTKRKTKADLYAANRRHDANGNAWVRLALQYGEQVTAL